MRRRALSLYDRPFLRIVQIPLLGLYNLQFNSNMKFSTALAAAAASLVATATAHGGVDQYIVGDTTYQGYVIFL
jgi:hypothetical protein